MSPSIAETPAPETFDRRSARRVPCALVLAEVTEAGAAPCRATNISERGVYLRRLGGGVLLEGELVHLELALPAEAGEGEAPPVWVAGRVVEQLELDGAHAAAVAFVALAESDRVRIRRYVDSVRLRQLRAAVAGLAKGARQPIESRHSRPGEKTNEFAGACGRRRDLRALGM